MTRAGVLLALLLAACSPSTSGAPKGISHPPVGPFVPLGSAAIAWDLAASSSAVTAGSSYVQHYTDHWAPLLARRGLSFRVTVVPRGTLQVGGLPERAFRSLATGEVVVTHDAAGAIYGVEWEVPLEAQGVNDPRFDPPADGSWGLYGPLYTGQSAENVRITNGGVP